MNPYQRIIIDGNIIQEGHINTQIKFKQLTKGINFTGKTYLDIGCNLGEMLRLAKAEGAIHVVGIDERRDYIEEARMIDNSVVLDVRKAEYVTGNYDIVVASAMFHYIKDHDRFFNQMARATNEVFIIDVWLENNNESAKFYLTDRGLFIPNKKAFLHIASKYFKYIQEIEQSISPDGSYRVIYHMRQPTPNEAQAILITGTGGAGKTTLARTYFDYEHLQLDSIFVEMKVIKEAGANLSTSIMGYVDDNHDNEDYLNYHKKYISKWLDYKLNLDIVIEGYDMMYPKYMNMVNELLKEKGWTKIETVML